MAFDPFADEPRPVSKGHEIGQDLALLSIDEINERIELLEKEIARLKDVRAGKESSRAAASAFFKKGQG
ncbi:DUF1192 domain-containing protein [Microvirga terricola]|uniref:DUF1192 domain-containing protein n=1 Tax=Microvirga terricola TaxID=2719797 RepID=A0ABX0VE56_9HYPH|nr:DUF1192 domain-containing protein [Microvirga terricola]NIX77932.1 DUF1192 domain-containing protein [Microvirga terricola]